MKRVTAIFHGRVQGVGFRATTRMKAQDFDVNGYVQNLPDGTVKMVAEGEESNIEKLLDWLKSRELFGSKIVEKVDVKYEEATGEFEEFSIKR